MNRRSFVAAVCAVVATGTAGCSNLGSGRRDPTPTPSPEPAESELRLRVANGDTVAHDVAFVLRVTQNRTTVVEAFEFEDVGPGETRTRDPQELPAGEYELEIEIRDPISMGTTSRWAGHDCPVKTIEVELTEDGIRKRDTCRKKDEQ